LRRGLVVVSTVDGNVAALASQIDRDCGANSLGPTSNERALSG
jgi:hypothetical protein